MIVAREGAATAPAWRGVAVFLAVAFGLPWPAQIGLSLALRDAAGGLAALGGALPVAAPFLMWPPAVGAFVVRRWIEGGCFGNAGLRWSAWRWVALAWFAPALATLLAAALSLPIYPFDPTFGPLRDLVARSGQPLPVSPALLVAVQACAALTIAVPINSLFAFGEEFGWCGYLLPCLIALLGPWPGLLAHGAIWGGWHAPLILLLGFNYPGHPVLGVPLFVVTGALLGVLFGWLHLASGSVVPPTVAHGALNAIGALPLLVLRGADPAVAGPIYSPVGWIVLLLAITGLVAGGGLGRAPGAVGGAGRGRRP